MVKGFFIGAALACAAISSAQNVRLVLLERLTSGMKVGTKVPMIVAQDVKDQAGNVLVKADTPAYGEIVTSRRSGTLSNLLDTPARLALQLGNTYSANQKPLKLKSLSGKSVLNLTRDNTSQMAHDEKIAAAWKDPQTREMLKQLVQGFDANSPMNLSQPQLALLEKNAAQLSLTNTAQLCQSGQLSALNGYLASLRGGSAFVAPAGVDAVLLGACAVELADLCRHSAGFIGGRFLGRNICALPGTVIEAQVVKS